MTPLTNEATSPRATSRTSAYRAPFAFTGGVIDKTMPIDQSNVAIYNAATGKADRVAIKLLADGKKVRVFKSSGEEIKAAKA